MQDSQKLPLKSSIVALLHMIDGKAARFPNFAADIAFSTVSKA